VDYTFRNQFLSIKRKFSYLWGFRKKTRGTKRNSLYYVIRFPV